MTTILPLGCDLHGRRQIVSSGQHIGDDHAVGIKRRIEAAIGIQPRGGKVAGVGTAGDKGTNHDAIALIDANRMKSHKVRAGTKVDRLLTGRPKRRVDEPIRLGADDLAAADVLTDKQKATIGQRLTALAVTSLLE